MNINVLTVLCVSVYSDFGLHAALYSPKIYFPTVEPLVIVAVMNIIHKVINIMLKVIHIVHISC